MNKHHRIKLFFISVFTLLFFASCVSTENVYILNADNGNLVFIRPVNEKVNDNSIKSILFDITITLDKKHEIDSAVVNWTVTFTPGTLYKENTVNLKFMNGDKLIELNETDLLYKDLDKKKNLTVRFSSKITKEDVLLLLNNYNNVWIEVDSENQKNKLESEDFKNKLMEAGLIIL